MNDICSCHLLGQLNEKYYLDCCCYSVTQSYPTLCDPMDCSTPGFHPCPSLSWSLLKLRSVVSNIQHLILCCPLLLLPSIFPYIKLFSSELALCIGWPKYWSFSFSIHLPMNIQSWFPLKFSDLISLQSKGLSRVFSSTTIQKHQFFVT